MRTEAFPETASLEDIRPGAVIDIYRKGRSTGEQCRIVSFPYMANALGEDSVWVDTVSTYEGYDREFESTVSLADHGIIPYGHNGLYNNSNSSRLARPAPIEDPTLPRKLRRALGKPYAEMTSEERKQATVHYMGMHAADFLERKKKYGTEGRLLDESLFGN